MPAYVKNKELLEQIIISRDRSCATPELLEMFNKISTKLSTKFSYKNPDDRKDCIQGGINDAWYYFSSFDPSKSSNAFAYITQIIKNGMAKQYKILYKDNVNYKRTTGDNYYRISLSQGNIHSL